MSDTPKFELELAEYPTGGFYFQFIKYTVNGEYTMDIDDDAFCPQFATSLGWDGDPCEYDEAKQLLIDGCPFYDREWLIGVSVLWDEMGGQELEKLIDDEIAEAEAAEEDEENTCEDCGEPLGDVGDAYTYDDGVTEYKLCPDCFSWRPPMRN